MSSHRFLWLSIALLSALGAFFSVRAIWPGTPNMALPAAIIAKLPGSSLASTGIDAALGDAAKGGDILARRLRVLELLSKAAPAELRLLLLSKKSTRREKRSITQRWAEIDAPGLCAFLKGLSRTEWDRDAPLNDWASDILFRTWALQDPDAALAAASALSSRPQFQKAQWTMVTILFEQDPAKGFALAATLPNQSDPPQERLMDAVWKKNPAAFLKAAGDSPPGAFRNHRVIQAVDSAFADLAKKNSSAAAAWLKSLPLHQLRRLSGQMAFLFFTANPAAATAWFKDMPPSPEREKAGVEIVNAWAQKDPPAALEWLQDNLQGGRPQAFAHLATALAEKGIESAKQLLEAMPSGTQRDEVVRVIANKWAAKDFKPAMAWVLSLPTDDPGRRTVVQQMSDRWAYEDLPTAAAYFQENPYSPEGQNMLQSVISNFASKDIGGGLAWAATLPSAPQKKAQMFFYEDAVFQKKLPQVFAALEKMPVSEQQAMVGNIAEGVLYTTYGDADLDGRFTNSLQQLPAYLREVARSAIQKSASGSTERKASALNALK